VSKGDPIPTRFDQAEEEAVDVLHRRTGLPRAEIIRRAMRLLRLRFEHEGSVGFILEELSPAPLKKIKTVTSYSAEEREKKQRSKGLMIPERPTPTKKAAEYRDGRGKGPSKRGKSNPDDRKSNEGYKKPDDRA
jgi:hypothetical protein